MAADNLTPRRPPPEYYRNLQEHIMRRRESQIMRARKQSKKPIIPLQSMESRISVLQSFFDCYPLVPVLVHNPSGRTLGITHSSQSYCPAQPDIMPNESSDRNKPTAAQTKMDQTPTLPVAENTNRNGHHMTLRSHSKAMQNSSG